MLVIARRVGEALYIGPDVMLVIREVQGKQVRIGIEAPPSVAVARAELLPPERSASVGEAAASGGGDGDAD